MTITLTRRSIAAALGLAAVPVTVEAIQPSAAPAAPSEAELLDYYMFLWSEFRRLADEMGVEPFDAHTSHRAGGVRRFEAMTGGKPATGRAKAVLAAIRA